MPFIIGMHSSALAVAEPPADVRDALPGLQGTAAVPLR